ncbi:MAG TPA: hypothetical protein VGI08_10385 [Diaminobutyricibacter sp.]|uniref:hypothetical protein n=1 Tax=Leifsonia sp. McL0618 TaxID=3415677 RepID=UPI00337E73E6
MRFVLAIVAFVVAAVLIVAGIAQRTVFAPPSQVSAATTVSGAPRFIMVDGSVLNSHPGQQTLYVDGAPNELVAYGRTADVTAWLGDQSYATLKYDATSGSLTSKSVAPQPADDAQSSTGTAPSTTPPPVSGTAKGEPVKGPNPAGSDLWLEQFSGPDANVTRMNVPNNVSVIIASDGTAPAPNQIRIVWPLDSSTPWAGPLIVGGGVLLIIGLALYLWGLYALRRSRGPRRKGGPKMPKLPKAPKYKPTKAIETTPKGRRSARRALVAVPVVLVGALALSGCSGDYWPHFGAAAPLASSTPITTELPKAKDVQPPAVTVPQLERIMTKISAVATAADAKLDSKAIATRFTGPALELRQANYAIRAKKSDEPALPAVAAGPLALTLPQATDMWPRVVSTVVQGANKTQAPQAITLVQQTPRSNYLVTYAVSLEPKAKVPDLAPASIGAAVVPPDSKLLLLPPQQVATAYGDILMKGPKSTYFNLFEAKGDTLRPSVGLEYKTKKQAAIPKTASLTFSNKVGSGTPIAMATNDSGAIVWTNLDETETLKVVEAGAEVNAGASSAALSGVSSSKKGIASTYGYQLAFYVPPAGSDQKITLLGFAQGLVSAKEVQ